MDCKDCGAAGMLCRIGARCGACPEPCHYGPRTGGAGREMAGHWLRCDGRQCRLWSSAAPGRMSGPPARCRPVRRGQLADLEAHRRRVHFDVLRLVRRGMQHGEPLLVGETRARVAGQPRRDQDKMCGDLTKINTVAGWILWWEHSATEDCTPIPASSDIGETSLSQKISFVRSPQ